MTKITADQLGRSAFVYIRQSTADQLLHNPESRRRQYGLADRARQLGWTVVEVIDDDLGRSGGPLRQGPRPDDGSVRLQRDAGKDHRSLGYGRRRQPQHRIDDADL